MDRAEDQQEELFEVELEPYDAEKAEVILDRLAELLFSVWLKRREAATKVAEGEDPERPGSGADGDLERVAS